MRRRARPLRDVRVPPHERRVLPNGARLVIVPRREVPLVAFCAIVSGGARCDAAGRSGLSALVAGLLGKGAGARDAFGFANAVEGVGGSFHAAATADHLIVSGQCLSAHTDRMLELLADALLAPSLSRVQLEKLRARQIELIKAAKDSDPAELLATYGRAFLFRGHPYGRPVTGGEDSLASIGIGDVTRYYRAHFGADRLALVLAGDASATRLARAAGRLLGAWRPAGRPLPPLAPPREIRVRRVLLIDQPRATQSSLWIGGLGVDRRYGRRAALDLVNTLFGGRFTSLLNSALRIRSGLSYGAASSFARGAVRGEFAIQSVAETSRTAEALDLALAALARLKRAGVTGEMLESARAYALGQYPLSLETAADWAFALGDLEAYRLAPESIGGYAGELRRVSLEDTRRVIAEAFPDPQRVVIVVIGDAARIRAPLARYGPVTETELIRPGFDAPGSARRARPARAPSPSTDHPRRSRGGPEASRERPGSKRRSRPARGAARARSDPAPAHRPRRARRPRRTPGAPHPISSS